MGMGPFELYSVWPVDRNMKLWHPCHLTERSLGTREAYQPCHTLS